MHESSSYHTLTVQRLPVQIVEPMARERGASQGAYGVLRQRRRQEEAHSSPSRRDDVLHDLLTDSATHRRPVLLGHIPPLSRSVGRHRGMEACVDACCGEHDAHVTFYCSKPRSEHCGGVSAQESSLRGKSGNSRLGSSWFGLCSAGSQHANARMMLGAKVSKHWPSARLDWRPVHERSNSRCEPSACRVG
jgi:hypothetical protein